MLVQPLRITVGERNVSAASVSQRLVFVGQEGGKLLALRQLLAAGATPPVLVSRQAAGLGLGEGAGAGGWVVLLSPVPCRTVLGLDGLS